MRAATAAKVLQDETLREFGVVEIPYPDGHGTASIQLRHLRESCQADVLQIDDSTVVDMLQVIADHECENPEPETWQWRGETLMAGSEDEFGWRLAVDPNVAGNMTGVWAVWWTDYVANEWAEEYDDQGTALARLALLLSLPTSDQHTHSSFRHITEGSWAVAWETAVKYQFAETVVYAAQPVPSGPVDETCPGGC